MKKRLLILFIIEIISLRMVHAQVKYNEILEQIGFENISVASSDRILYVAFEDNIYRWNIKGIAAALDALSALPTESDIIKLLVISEGVPRYVVSTQLTLWKRFRQKDLSPEAFRNEIDVSYDTHDVMNALKGTVPDNKNVLKTDLVIYPEIKVWNAFTDRNYDIQLNISPALETNLWRGGKSIIQFIFPIVNSSRVFGEEGKYIRPGYVILKQELRLFNRFYTSIESGLFNQNRYGFSISNEYFLNEYFAFSLQYAFTGSSYFGEKWRLGTINTSTWSGKGSYYFKWINSHINLSVNRYLSSNTGYRLELFRMFGETGIGVYGLLVDGSKNAGFNFRVPISLNRQSRKGKLRITIPNHFNWEYSASNIEDKAIYPHTQPDDIKRTYTENPVYIKYQLLNL